MPHEKTRFFTSHEIEAMAQNPQAWDIPNGGWVTIYDPANTVRKGRGADGKVRFEIKAEETRRLVCYEPDLKTAFWAVWEPNMNFSAHNAAYRKGLSEAMHMIKERKKDHQALQRVIEHLPPDFTVQKLKEMLQSA